MVWFWNLESVFINFYSSISSVQEVLEEVKPLLREVVVL